MTCVSVGAASHQDMWHSDLVLHMVIKMYTNLKRELEQEDMEMYC